MTGIFFWHGRFEAISITLVKNRTTLRYLTLIPLLVFTLKLNAQTLQLKQRKADAMTGSAFAKAISDSTITLKKRERQIYKEIKSGNVPDFLRSLQQVTDSKDWDLGIDKVSVTYFVLPDYFCIGNNNDFFYIPMTPVLAQRIAKLTKTSLPTKRMVDQMYKNAKIKLVPQPISPSKLMTTVPIFIAHNDSIKLQLNPYILKHIASELTAGSKKDIIISNKIYGENTKRVVIYGWHKLDGKPIQPVYNKHTNNWADYSHGVRLIQNNVIVNNNGIDYKTTIQKVLKSNTKNYLLSDEGLIAKPFYPTSY